jgi:hypothetical protein
MARRFPALHSAGHLDGSSEEQQLLGERRFPRVGVGNDRESSPSVDFVRNSFGQGRGSGSFGMGRVHNLS